MSTDPARMPSSPAPAAERMRLYRKRRRQGMQYVRIPLREAEVQDLIWMGHLGEGQRHDAEAIQAAVLGLLRRHDAPAGKAASGHRRLGRDLSRHL
jgi:hypothetical protein